MRVDEIPKLNHIWLNCTGGGRVRGLGEEAGILKILYVSGIIVCEGEGEGEVDLRQEMREKVRRGRVGVFF